MGSTFLQFYMNTQLCGGAEIIWSLIWPSWYRVSLLCHRLGAGVVCDGEYLILFWWWWRRKNWEWSLATILYLLGHLNLIVCIQMWLPRPRRAPPPAASVHTQAITSHIVTPIDDGQNQERKDVCITYFIKVRRWLFYALATRCYYWSADLVSVARPPGKINHYC